MVTMWSFTQSELSFYPYVRLRLKHMLTLLLLCFSDHVAERLFR
jgi:hypothetical protein